MTTTVTTILVAIIGSGIINTILTRLFNSHDKKSEEKKALRLLMKDRLRFLCNQYIAQGWIYEDELEDIIAMHKCYHDDLGGNGFLDDLMTRVRKLEIRGIGVR